MNFKRWAAGAAALMLALAAPAAAETAAPPQPVNPALFVVRDADSAIYLFGTVHVRRPGSAWGGANAQAALAEADEVWTELEMSSLAQQEAMQLTIQYGFAPADQPLSSMLTAEQNTRLAELAASMNMPAAMFERMRPWLAAITLSVGPMLQAGYDPSAGVDRSIDAVAAEAGKTRRAFETIEQQIGFLANLSEDVQHAMLVEALAGAGETPGDLEVMMRAWEKGDLVLLERLVLDETRTQYPEVYDVLFVQRNNAWVATLLTELDGSGVDFVAVGAGHLLGEDGLVAQLRARGLSVERVSPAR